MICAPENVLHQLPVVQVSCDTFFRVRLITWSRLRKILLLIKSCPLTFICWYTVSSAPHHASFHSAVLTEQWPLRTIFFFKKKQFWTRSRTKHYLIIWNCTADIRCWEQMSPCHWISWTYMTTKQVQKHLLVFLSVSDRCATSNPEGMGAGHWWRLGRRLQGKYEEVNEILYINTSH